METHVPDTAPQPVAPDTWLIPNLFPAGDDLYIPVNSMVIRSAEPVIVDTSAPLYRDRWREQVFSIVEPEDVRWIFLSHDDGDHTGGLLDALELCPRATLVTNFFMVERLALEKPPLPLERMRWIDPGGSFDAGDRTLHLFKPPLFDGPTTRGLYDSRTAAMWIVDSFPCLTPGPLNDVRELPRDLVEESMRAMSSLVSPWHQWLDPAAYRVHVDAVEALGVAAVASAHGPIIAGGAIHEAFDRVRQLAGEPIIPAPGQELSTHSSPRSLRAHRPEDWPLLSLRRSAASIRWRSARPLDPRPHSDPGTWCGRRVLTNRHRSGRLKSYGNEFVAYTLAMLAKRV